MNLDNVDEKSLIVTQDKEKNLMLGILRIGDIEELKKIRDSLMHYSKDSSNYIITTTAEKASLQSILQSGFIREGDDLIYKGLFSSPFVVEDPEFCEYTQSKYHFNYLNTVLIITSLLRELDATNYDALTKTFIGYGVIRCLPIELMWPLASENLYSDFNSKNLDLMEFLKLLTNGIIYYDVLNKISKSDLNHSHIRPALLQNLKQIEINSNLLLGDDSAFTKKRTL